MQGRCSKKENCRRERRRYNSERCQNKNCLHYTHMRWKNTWKRERRRERRKTIREGGEGESGREDTLSDGDNVAYMPITLLFISFMFIESILYSS